MNINLEIKRMFDKIRSQGYPVVQSAFDSKSLIEYLMAIFEMNDEFSSFSRDELLKLIQDYIGTWIDAAPVGDGGSSTVINDLVNYGLPRSQILGMYWLAHCAPKKDKREVTTLYRYYQTVYTPEKGEEKKAGKNPGEEFYIHEGIFNSKFAKLTRIKPADFIRTFLYSKGFGDIAVEHACFDQIIRRYLENSNKRGMLFVDPHPDFVEEYAGLSGLYKMKFLFFDRELMDVYKKAYSRGVFEYYTRDSSENEFDFDEFSALNIVFDEIVVFGHRDCETVKNFLDGIENYVSDDTHISIMLPQTWIDTDKSFREMLCKRMKIKCISILPSKAFTSDVKKHVCIYATKGTCSDKDSFQIERILFLLKEKKHNKLSGYLLKEPWILSIGVLDFVDHASKYGKCTIKQLFEIIRPKSEIISRSSAKKFDLTQEISIWYSFSNGRGTFTYYGIANDEEMSKKRLNRGKPLVSIPYRSNTEDEAKDKIRRRILGKEELKEDDFTKTVVADIRKEYLESERGEKNMSLLSYWICRRSILADNRLYNNSLCLELFDSDVVANTMSDERIDRQAIVREIVKITGRDNNEETLKYLRQLYLILKEAQSERPKRFENEDICEYIDQLNRKKKGYRAARESLTKKSYTFEEEIKIVQYLYYKLQTTQDRKYLGALICYFTGCTNREAAALSWNDRESMAELKSQHQFLIYKEFSDTTSKPERIKATTSHNERYRRVPIVKELDDILYPFFKMDDSVTYPDKKNKTKGEDEECDEEKRNGKDFGPTVVCRVENGERLYVLPSEIRQAKIEAEEQLGLDGKIGFAKISDKEIETDFNKYQGDRFRTNFEYKLTENCVMSKAEINYILGRSQDNTFAKHYCDYTNDFSQIMLKAKMERWSSVFSDVLQSTMIEQEEHSEGMALVKEKGIRTTNKIIPDRYANKLTTNISGTISSETSETRIIVTDDRGVDIKIDLLEKRL